jgi:signal transduction histidine kinase
MAILQQDSGELLPVEIVPDMQPRRVFEVEARPLRSEVRQWVLTIRDVTLEREIQERSRQQERLATVGQLAAGIAHDFNNIMAAILVYTDLMLNDRSLPSTSYERLVIIQQQVQRAASLIRQILDFSRRSVMEQSEIDLLPFMKEMEKLLSRVLPETIHVEFTYDPGSYPVKVDPTRLQQVFMNLALNARDAMPNGGNLRFNLEPIHLLQGEKPPHPELTAGDWVRIEVVDSGQGIPKEILPHVFDPFFTTKPVGQGTGLGLAQVYGVIRQHNGQIDVTSQSGAGTHFRIYLQLLSQAKMEIDEKASTAIDGSGQQVLIVEDDPATREALCAMLAALNFDVLAAANGMEALNVLAERGGQVELVVSDLVMPEMGGIALYEILRDLIPNVKILFITGHPLEMRDQAVLERGEVHWLQKPFSMQEFSSAVKALL